MGAPLSRIAWTVAPLGDRAVLLEFGDRIDPVVNDAVHAACAWIRSREIPGCIDLVPAYASLAVHFDPAIWDTDTLASHLTPPPDGLAVSAHTPRATVTIPVRYGGDAGPDLEAAAAHAGLSPATFVDRHTAPEYRVMFLGFSPGFAYLGGLDPALAVPRRSSPRRSVPAGSVGIGGAQTAIYPSATPGGWHLIGRTGARLFDADADSPSRLQPGDRIKFVPVDELHDEPSTQHRRSSAAPGFRVERPGLLTTIQDLGRFGYQHLGVSPGGAADTIAHRVANLLVGNDENAATLEMTLLGPTLIATRALRIALCGAPFAASLEGKTLPLHQPVLVREGARLELGAAASGVRAYLAVAGGFDVPAVLGSRSTALRDRFGGFEGRAIRKGDELPVGDQVPGLPIEGGEPWLDETMNATPFRFLAGPHWESLTAEARAAFLDEPFTVTPHSDRMGIRLEGLTWGLTPIGANRIGVRPQEYISAGVATGTIQLPPEGQPIVLLADRQTTGGYPRIGEVITADLPRLAQLRPGDPLRFSLCSPTEAREAMQEQAGRLDTIRARRRHAVR